MTLASAHALVLLEEGGGIVGDPMEKTTLDALGWTMKKGDHVGPAPPAGPKKPPPQLALPPPKKGKVKAPEPAPAEEKPKPQNPHKATLQVKRRFQFSSALKRMSTVSIAQLPNSNKRTVIVSVKGAPETLKDMFAKIPDAYEQTYKHYAVKGSRVLALGYKFLENTSDQQITRLERSTVEAGLTFAGFLIFHCPLKRDAVHTIKALNDSSHRVGFQMHFALLIRTHF